MPIEGDPNFSPSAWNDVGSIRSGTNSARFRHYSSLQAPPPPPKKSWKKRFADGFRATVAFVFSKVGICVLVIGYLFVGAAMFQQLEGRVFQIFCIDLCTSVLKSFLRISKLQTAFVLQWPRFPEIKTYSHKRS